MHRWALKECKFVKDMYFVLAPESKVNQSSLNTSHRVKMITQQEQPDMSKCSAVFNTNKKE